MVNSLNVPFLSTVAIVNSLDIASSEAVLHSASKPPAVPTGVFNPVAVPTPSTTAVVNTMAVPYLPPTSNSSVNESIATHLPEAYHSKATHFSPIVLSSTAPPTLVQDLEADVLRERKVVSPMVTPPYGAFLVQQDPSTGRLFQLIPFNLPNQLPSPVKNSASSGSSADEREPSRPRRKPRSEHSNKKPRSKSSESKSHRFHRSSTADREELERDLEKLHGSSRQLQVYPVYSDKMETELNAPRETPPSPPLSPSWSKDSGVSGVNIKASDMSLMERLLSSETIRHQQRLAQIVNLVKDEFAFDGYMDNGVEDLAMAEYVMSLGNLKWKTFCSAITEKYPDLFFKDCLLINLYEAVNGKKPSHVREEQDMAKHTSTGSSVTMGVEDDEDDETVTSAVTLAKANQSGRRPIRLKKPYQPPREARKVTSCLDLSTPPQEILSQRHNDGSLIKAISIANVSGRYPVDRTSLPVDSRRGSWSSHSSERSQSVVTGRSESTVDGEAPVDKQAVRTRVGSGEVIYCAADLEFEQCPEAKAHTAQMDLQTIENIRNKMCEIDQQIMLEIRNRRKNLKYKQQLLTPNKTSKVDQKSRLNKVTADIEDSNKKLHFLTNVKKQIDIIYAERWGLDSTLLYALAKCPSNEGMLLAMCDNMFIQYQTIKSRQTGLKVQVLQAGTAQGLIGQLFAQHSVSESYIHQFLYCYRYFTTLNEVVSFLMGKFSAASLSLCPHADIPRKVMGRALDLLQALIEGYYTVDLQHRPKLVQELKNFLQKQVLNVDPSADSIIELLSECQEGQHKDLHYPQLCLHNYQHQSQSTEPATIKRWESFKAAFLPKSRSGKEEAYVPLSPLSVPSLGERSLVLTDWDPQTLAEQLTLMEQKLLQESHPVHYLDTKYLGVTVELTKPSMHRAHSLVKRTTSLDLSSSLFVEAQHPNSNIIERMIDHSRGLAFWAAAEVINCNNTKVQQAVLTLLLHTAKHCQDLRNFASAISIIDGLENLVVRQLPVWQSLPSKCVHLMDELTALKLHHKTDSQSLVLAPGLPTIPCTLLFLFHVQQLEIGGFTLANGMYRWPKLKYVAKLVDQIRIFKQYRYKLKDKMELQHQLLQRMETLGQFDLQTLAAQHLTTSIPRVSSGKSLFKFFKKK